MTVEIAELVESLQWSLNVPGDPRPLFDFTDEDPWIAQLGNAFWWAHMRKFFTDYRVSLDGDTIENVNGGDDLPRADQQVIVLFASMLAIEAKMLTMFTVTKDTAGPVATERQRSAQLLKGLLDQKRAELESIRDEQVNGGGATTVRVIDAVLARSGYPSEHPWVR